MDEKNDWLHNLGAGIVTLCLMLSPITFAVNLTCVITLPDSDPVSFLRFIGILIPGAISILTGIDLYFYIKDGGRK